MPRRAWFFAVPALLCLPFIPSSMGGWAIITVEELPEYLVAGRPATLRFTVRQHGVTLLGNLTPRLEAKSDGGQAFRRSDGPPVRQSGGQYAATLTFPSAGYWTVTIHSGFGASKLTLLPIPVVRPGTPAPAPLALAERGRRLFVAKGCIGCHTRNEDGLGRGEDIGPELTGKRYQAGFLHRFLSDPAANPTRTGTFRMPNLELREEEIAALARFLNGERTAAR